MKNLTGEWKNIQDEIGTIAQPQGSRLFTVSGRGITGPGAYTGPNTIVVHFQGGDLDGLVGPDGNHITWNNGDVYTRVS